MKWFRRTPEEPESLTCQCGHGKCYHYDGKLSCFERAPGDEYGQFAGLCACRTFIPVPAETTTVSELEEWARKKVHGG